jgi:serine protease Do
VTTARRIVPLALAALALALLPPSFAQAPVEPAQTQPAPAPPQTQPAPAQPAPSPSPAPKPKPAPRAQKVVPQSRAEFSYAPLVKKAAPAVVNIYARRVVQRRNSPFLDDPFFRRFFGDDVLKGIPRERIENSLGSGVIVRANGLIVTNSHVIRDASEITVVLADRREFPARIVTTDDRTDLSLLRIDAGRERLPFIDLRDSDQLEVGDVVLAIGNPFGVGQTVTSGIISALARTAEGVSDYSFFIQTDAAINPGNSGGALIGMDGRLVGINTAIYSRTGGSVGIGFAIPANMVATVIASERSGGKVVRAWLGASGETVTADIAKSLKLKRPIGVLINQIYPNGPADLAGLRAGDVLIQIDGKEVDDIQAVRFRVATLAVGETATLKVLRQGQEVTLGLALTPPPEDPPREATPLKGRHPLAGATVANMSPALADELQIDALQKGVVVTHIVSGSAAARLGLQPGDFITQVNGAKVQNVAGLKAEVEKGAPRWQLAIRRAGRTMTVTIEGS